MCEVIVLLVGVVLAMAVSLPHLCVSGYGNDAFVMEHEKIGYQHLVCIQLLGAPLSVPHDNTTEGFRIMALDSPFPCSRP